MKPGRFVAQLLRKAVGFNPPSRLFSRPLASEYVFTAVAACVIVLTLKPCLNMSGLIKPVREEMLLAMPTASDTLPAALSQLVLPPLAQLVKKEAGFNAPANCFSKLPGLGLALVSPPN